MASFSKGLLELTANDLMSRETVVLSGEMSLRHAAHLLSQAQVTGAPVVDAEGRCIGVLSATDFLHWAKRGTDGPKKQPVDVQAFSAWQVIDPESLPPDRVSDYMTSNPVLVSPLTPIGVLAQMMLDAHIHRLIVVDAEQKPIGIVSTMDVLAAVAGAQARIQAHAALPS